METNNYLENRPSFGKSFGDGMRLLGDNFLRLFLIIIIIAFIQAPAQGFRISIQVGGFNWAIGIFAIFALLYSFLVIPVFQYGGDILFVHAVRKQHLDFKLMVKGFSENYLNIILSSLLVFALVLIGIMFLIVPGIIIGCRLAFVTYLVMDRNLDPVSAIEESWRLTKGYGWTIFAMGLVSFFIILFGLVLLIIGIFPAIIWVSSAFAVLYQDVLVEKGEAPEVVTE